MIWMNQEADRKESATHERSRKEEEQIQVAIALAGGIENLVQIAKEYAISPKPHQGDWTVVQALREFSKEVAEKDWEYKYYRNMQTQFRRVQDDLGDKELGSLTVSTIYTYLVGVRDSVGYQTARQTRTVLSKVFGHAVLKGRIQTNIIRDVPGIRRAKGETQEIEYLSCDEVETLFDVMQQNEQYTMLLPWMTLGLYAGLRSEEIIKDGEWVLPLDSIDEEHREIVVSKTVAKRAGGVPRPRVIDDLPNAFWAYWKLAKKHRVESPTELDSLRRDLFAGTGIVKDFHSLLRHTYATHASALLGEETVARQLGHQTTTILNRHYKASVSKRVAKRYFKED